MQPFPCVAWKVFEMRRGPLRDGEVDAERDLTVNRPCLPVVTRDEESGVGRVDAWRGKQLLAVRDNSRAMPPEVVVPLRRDSMRIHLEGVSWLGRLGLGSAPSRTEAMTGTLDRKVASKRPFHELAKRRSFQELRHPSCGSGARPPHSRASTCLPARVLHRLSCTENRSRRQCSHRCDVIRA